MDKSVFYTKGDKNEVLKRMNQVHTITLYCPFLDYGVNEMFQFMAEFLPKYNIRGQNNWNMVPTIDAFNIFLYTSNHCKKSNIDLRIISILAGTLKSFPKLKYINFEFTYEKNIYDEYMKLVSKVSPSGVERDNVFKIESMEMNLVDFFSQEIIDIFNRVMIMNEMIPNSYLERKFKIDFKYDEYKAFINMFLSNNGEVFNRLDKNICDYFGTFPDVVENQKPNIRIITNYSEL